MNIYQTVINSVAASGADVTQSGGFINIAGLSIPQGLIAGAKRVLVGERPQTFTVTAPATVSNGVTYSVTVSGKSPVTGILKSFFSVYTTPATGNTQAGLAAALAAGFAVSADFPFTVSYVPAATSFTLTAKSGTPVISVAANPVIGTNPLVVANTTTTRGTGYANSGLGYPVIKRTTGTNFATGDIGSIMTLSSGDNSYTGIVKEFVDTDTLKTLPYAATLAGTGNAIYVIDNTGAVLESTYSYASLPGVTLSPSTKYVIYEIDAVAANMAGNGARPDLIDGKYVIYVNAADTNVWSSGGFDDKLATACGLSSF